MFIVLADSRTGSHLLKSLLNSHPDLTCYDEILGLRKNEKDFYSLQRGEGCLVSYPNLVQGSRWAEGNDVKRLVRVISRCKVIHLTRDLDERARSQLFYSKVKDEHSVFYKANLEKDYEFDASLDEHSELELEQLKEHFTARQDDCLRQFASARQHWLNVDYQWLCGNQQIRSLSKEKAAVLCNYLQVPVTELHTNLYKIRKFVSHPA